MDDTEQTLSLTVFLAIYDGPLRRVCSIGVERRILLCATLQMAGRESRNRRAQNGVYGKKKKDK